MTETDKGKGVLTPAYIVNSIICVILMIFFRFLPPFGEITPYGMEILGIFLGSIYGWVFVGFVWPSFLGMIMLGLSEYGTIEAVFSEGFGASIVLNLMLTFIFFAYINKSGLMQWVANRFISLKINMGHPWLLTFSFFFIATYVAAITNAIAVTILLWCLFYQIADQVGYQKGERYVSYVLCGIAFFATVSIVIFPFLPYSLVGIGLMKTMVDFGEYSTLGWIISGTIVSLLMIIAYLLFGRFIFKVDVSKLASVSEEEFAKMRVVKMGHSEKVGVVYLLLFLAIVVVPTLLPKDWALVEFLSNFSVIGGCAVCFVGICFMKNSKGESVVKFGDLISAGVNWEMIMLMIATVPICAAIEDETTGIMPTLLGGIMPIFESVSPLVLVILIVVLFGIITQFAHNLILQLVFGPTLAALCAGYGIPPIVFCMLFMMVTQTAIATPGASVNSAMVFGNTEWIEKKHAVLIGIAFAMSAFLIYIVIGYPINMMMN